MYEKRTFTVKYTVSQFLCLKILLLVGIFSFLFLPSAQALNIPNLQGYVNDYADMITPSVKGELENKLRAFERKDSTQIVILTIPSLDGEMIEKFSLKVANEWKLGQRGKDNGILFLVSKQDRKMRIEVGRGLEKKLPNPVAGKIIDEIIKPKFAGGDFDGGFIAGASALIDVTKGAYTAEEKVKWTPNVCSGLAGFEMGIWGKVDPSVDLADDQIARQLLQEGRRVYLQSCPSREHEANTYGVYVRLLKGNQEVANAVVTKNGFSSYHNEARRSRSIKSFISKFKVGIWLDSNEMKSQLRSNPFQWKGKIIGSEAEFGGMLSENSGIFDLGQGLAQVIVVVKKLPSALFTKSGERFLLVGRVQGVSQVQLPFLGNALVPELTFIGAESTPSQMPR